MLATQWNHILAEDKLAKNGVVMLKKYITNSVHNRRIVIIVEVEVLNREASMRIGEPINIEPGQSMMTMPSTTTTATGNMMNQRQDSFDANDTFGMNTTHLSSSMANTTAMPMKTSTTTVTTSNNSSNGPAITTNRTTMTTTTPSSSNMYGVGNSNSSSIIKTSTSRDEESSMSIFPIKSINPYQNRWTIKARVAQKSEIKTWRNAKGDGKLFSLDLIDDSGEIRATAFNDTVDKFYDSIEVNKVYYISKAQVRAAKRQFSSIRNEYELTLDVNSTVQPVSFLFRMSSCRTCGDDDDDDDDLSWNSISHFRSCVSVTHSLGFHSI